MTRMLTIGLALVLGTALLPQGTPSAAAAKAKAQKQQKQVGNGRPIWVTDLTEPWRPTTSKRKPPTITIKRRTN